MILGLFARCNGTNVLLVAFCLGLIACGRAKKPSVEVALAGSPNPDNHSINTLVSNASSTITSTRTSVESPLEFRRTTTCLDLIDSKLESLRWFEVASQSCFPGSRRQGAVAIQTVVRDHPARVEMPAGVQDHCWIALIAASSLNTPLVVELLDIDGAPHPFETVADTRNVVPSRGTFCSLLGHFRGLRFKTDSTQKLEVNVAWYFNPSSLP